VGNVDAAVEAVLAAGGGSYDPAVSVPVAGAGVVRFAYMTDPEGNVIEVQSWLSADGL
jgi:predicted enzyme related to lactoylglutathione lyase